MVRPKFDDLDVLPVIMKRHCKVGYARFEASFSVAVLHQGAESRRVTFTLHVSTIHLLVQSFTSSSFSMISALFTFSRRPRLV